VKAATPSREPDAIRRLYLLGAMVEAVSHFRNASENAMEPSFSSPFYNLSARLELIFAPSWLILRGPFSSLRQIRTIKVSSLGLPQWFSVLLPWEKHTDRLQFRKK
jgi:hypothetical protein